MLNAKAEGFGKAATLFLGVLLPLSMALATKSSPLMLGIAAAFSLVSFISLNGFERLQAAFAALRSSFAMQVSFGLCIFMAASLFWAHNIPSSSNQFVQFLIPLVSGLTLAVCFPEIATRNRVLPWVCAIMITASVVVIDIRTGLKLRTLIGGRVTDYSYNRTIVTVCVLVWPLLALFVARKQSYLALLFLPLPAAAWVGESGTAAMALLLSVVVFPVAYFLPVFCRTVGLWLMMCAIAAAPFSGTLSTLILGKTFHKTLEGAHSSERVDIWLSFEAVVKEKLFFGNGFGSSLNLQDAAVAQLIPPERVFLLNSSHPHNAFLQLWVELGLVGAAFAAVLTVLLFRAVGKSNPLVQPFLLTWIAVVASVSLVSHGAWQAWWIASIAASAVGFITLERELKNDRLV